MSMRFYPTGGYVVQLDKLLPFVPASDQQEIARLRDDESDAEAIESLLFNTLPSEWPKPIHVFQLHEEDYADDELSNTDWLVQFDDDDLFEIRDKPAMLRMRAAKVAPELHNWARFG